MMKNWPGTRENHSTLVESHLEIYLALSIMSMPRNYRALPVFLHGNKVHSGYYQSLLVQNSRKIPGRIFGTSQGAYTEEPENIAYFSSEECSLPRAMSIIITDNCRPKSLKTIRSGFLLINLVMLIHSHNRPSQTLT